MGTKRDRLVVVSNHGTSKNPDFRMHFPGIIPLNQRSQIIWFAGEAWRKEVVTPKDQIILPAHLYGVRAERSLRLKGCVPEAGWRVTSQSSPGRELFLTSCNQEVIASIPKPQSPVSYDLKEGILESSNYVYRYNLKNHMLFKSIEFKRSDGSRFEIARNADLLIRADIKNFFTMQFDSSDIVSQMKSSRSENIGALATLSFYLNILFFKISLDLDTDVRFFNDSSHIPMVLTVPVNAKQRLNPKSGVLYSFELEEPSRSAVVVNMPLLGVGPTSTSEALRYCQGERCVYSLSAPAANSGKECALLMELILPRRLVEFGMFPHYVEDVSRMASDMKWSLPKGQSDQRRAGLYLEVSGLPEGEFPWDFSMTLSSNSGEAIVKP